MAIFIDKSSENTKLLVYRSSFTLCYTTSRGASIYYNGGSIILFQSCGTKSKSNSDVGTFLYSYSLSSQNLSVFLNETTISECGEPLRGQATNYLYYGNQIQSSSNISKNLGVDGTVFLIYPSTILVKFCTCERNNATYSCHGVHNSISYFDHCNYIQNIGTESIFLLDKKATFHDCYFLENTKGKEFYNSNAVLVQTYYDGETRKVTIFNPVEDIPNEIPYLSLGSCVAKIPMKQVKNQICNSMTFDCNSDASFIKLISVNLSEISFSK